MKIFNIKNINFNTQLGNKGSEGITYLYTYLKHEYAIKIFYNNITTKKFLNEIKLQYKASLESIAPKIIGYDIKNKAIIMEKMDKHLINYNDILIKNKQKKITIDQQKKIFNILKKLDDIAIFHNDPNLLNFMYLNNQLFIIDFGYAKIINTLIINKYGRYPNQTYSLLAFILKLKEHNFPSSSYSYLLSKL